MELMLLIAGLFLCVLETHPPKNACAQLAIGSLMTIAIIPVVFGCWLVDKLKG